MPTDETRARCVFCGRQTDSTGTDGKGRVLPMCNPCDTTTREPSGQVTRRCEECFGIGVHSRRHFLCGCKRGTYEITCGIHTERRYTDQLHECPTCHGTGKIVVREA